MQYLICINVFIMGDDYMYGTFAHSGVIKSVWSYYHTGNGRWLINILDSIQLLFGRYLYLIITPWLELILGFSVYKLVRELTGKENQIILFLSIVLLSIIDIQVTCETTYWITGSMNYLLPAILLINSMIFTLKLREEQLSKREEILYSVMCILACLTMEQYGLMAIGWSLLIWGYDTIKNKRVIERNGLILLLCIIALGTIVFAPANHVRITDAAAKGNSIFVKFIDLIYYDYYSRASSVFIFILEAVCSYKYFNNKRVIQAVLSAINAGIILILFDYRILGISFAWVIISILISSLTIIPKVFDSFRKTGYVYFFALIVIGGGSQLMLLATDLWGFRTSFSWIIVVIILFLILIADDVNPKEYIIYAGLVCMAVNPFLGIISALAVYFCNLERKRNTAATVTLLILTVCVGLWDEVKGYYENKDIHIRNIETVQSASEENIDIIKIYPYDNLQYGWSSPPFSDFHERYFRSYYSIPNSVIVEYAEEN